ncbi:hypothetical protein ACHAWF_012393 [Thalassiosira exigua]
MYSHANHTALLPLPRTEKKASSPAPPPSLLGSVQQPRSATVPNNSNGGPTTARHFTETGKYLKRQRQRTRGRRREDDDGSRTQSDDGGGDPRRRTTAGQRRTAATDERRGDDDGGGARHRRPPSEGIEDRSRERRKDETQRRRGGLGDFSSVRCGLSLFSDDDDDDDGGGGSRRESEADGIERPATAPTTRDGAIFPSARSAAGSGGGRSRGRCFRFASSPTRDLDASRRPAPGGSGSPLVGGSGRPKGQARGGSSGAPEREIEEPEERAPGRASRLFSEAGGGPRGSVRRDRQTAEASAAGAARLDSRRPRPAAGGIFAWRAADLSASGGARRVEPDGASRATLATGGGKRCVPAVGSRRANLRLEAFHTGYAHLAASDDGCIAGALPFLPHGGSSHSKRPAGCRGFSSFAGPFSRQDTQVEEAMPAIGPIGSCRASLRLSLIFLVHILWTEGGTGVLLLEWLLLRRGK